MTYNREGTLRGALDSLLPQVDALEEVELLVCDNASTDGTEGLVAGYLEKHPKMRYHRNPENVRFDGNVMACINNARGEYLMFFPTTTLRPRGY